MIVFAWPSVNERSAGEIARLIRDFRQDQGPARHVRFAFVSADAGITREHMAEALSARQLHDHGGLDHLIARFIAELHAPLASSAKRKPASRAAS